MKLQQYQYPVFKVKVINIRLVMNPLIVPWFSHISWVSVIQFLASQFPIRVTYVFLINLFHIKHYVSVSCTLVSYTVLHTCFSQMYFIIFGLKIMQKSQNFKTSPKTAHQPNRKSLQSNKKTGPIGCESCPSGNNGIIENSACFIVRLELYFATTSYTVHIVI